jgi:3-hydroxyacyl-[acyl-carrier-protein] dehydratase
MPGLLQIESLAQTAALTLVTQPGLKGQVCYLSTVDKVQFRRKIVPGDRFEIAAKLISFRRGIARFEASGSVGGEMACKAEFTLIVQSILERFRMTEEGPS